MIDPGRLIHPPDDFRSAFPELDFRDVYELTTAGEPLLIADPTYLADVYNSADEAASFLRARGVFLMDFGGDVRCPVWWQPPYMILPTSNSVSDDEAAPSGVVVLAEDVHTDSGSFVFLPLTDEMPPELKESLVEILRDNNGVVLNLPSGLWRFYYEQFPAPGENLAGLYRNVVACHDTGG